MEFCKWDFSENALIIGKLLLCLTSFAFKEIVFTSNFNLQLDFDFDNEVLILVISQFFPWSSFHFTSDLLKLHGISQIRLFGKCINHWKTTSIYLLFFLLPLKSVLPIFNVTQEPLNINVDKTASSPVFHIHGEDQGDGNFFSWFLLRTIFNFFALEEI